MKKFLSLTLIFFFGTTLNSNAQDLYNYYDIYKTNDDAGNFQNKSSSSEINSIKFIENQQNFNKPNITKYPINNKQKSTFSKKSKTVGNYLGIDFINTSLRYKQISHGSIEPDLIEISDYTLPRHKNSFGVKYFYAINYNRFFLAPEIFFEYNNIKKNYDGFNAGTEQYNERINENYGYKFMKIHRIYGSKINFGYDLTPNFSPFLFAGLSKIYYSNLASVYTLSRFESRYDVINATGKDPFVVMHKSKNVPFFGFGSKIKISDHFSINAEYLIYNNFIAKTNGFKNKDFKSDDSYRADYVNFYNKLRIIKLGLLYNF
jgi:hypothetical protein